MAKSQGQVQHSQVFMKRIFCRSFSSTDWSLERYSFITFPFESCVKSIFLLSKYRSDKWKVGQWNGPFASWFLLFWDKTESKLEHFCLSSLKYWERSMFQTALVRVCGIRPTLVWTFWIDNHSHFTQRWWEASGRTMFFSVTFHVSGHKCIQEQIIWKYVPFPPLWTVCRRLLPHLPSVSIQNRYINTVKFRWVSTNLHGLKHTEPLTSLRYALLVYCVHLFQPNFGSKHW